MRTFLKAAVILGAALASTSAFAGDIVRKITAELDPVAPSSAVYEESNSELASSSKWGGQVDFNLAGVVSTGPEVWTGAFTKKGTSDPEETYRREDFWPGEKHKLDAIRLRWNVTKWEQAQSMRGWFMKAGYSYTRINSRANRYTEDGGTGDALPAGILGSPDDETDLVTDIRHGGMVGFGNRWLMYEQRISVTLGASFTQNFKRSITVESKDTNALADYENLIETIPDARMSVRPSPEANLGVGYSF
jgi:hypothetical protein